ncbi:hypothetical protein ABZ783_13355 [Micromonospora sp. NPDC047738]|uniref:hypothetical protein n=1 Tax=Micromonospora sp. NPDC047738 TaxID=3155741 RepID=UPI0033ED0DC0
MLATGRYPTVARLVIDGAHLNAEETFHHNLITILDGITSHPRTSPTARRPVPADHRLTAGLR